AGRVLLTSLMAGERCYQIGFGLADAIDELSRDRSETSPQNEPVTGGVHPFPPHRKNVGAGAGGPPIFAPPPTAAPPTTASGPAPSTASGIGPIGLAGDGRAVPPSPSIL